MKRTVDISAWGEEPPRWVELLAAEVRASNRTRTAERIGISRTAVSLLLANNYSSPSTDRMERRVLEALDGIHCPAQGKMITTEQCRAYRERPAPTHNPMAMRIWRTCQGCTNNPNAAATGPERGKNHV
ncbi:hypothetical protein [Marinobacter subterrani]|uniref:Uncharacterized protein n=1 Tax=Marinobacter subterrani TaxID=1658765 RepID=A0A0J7JEU2_9GAMM|nr:hypothetical protein [Marinobacter subterrani]KMQ75358.1 hypothetical protein Msub_11560 [Marinobacter subterrani]KMQ76988.1 hypothetical protein Msub_13203 [Marinobacter subterrani]